MVYVILGETASGKTEVALSICRRLHIPLISADAFSVYRGFDIGSAKPTATELEGIEHYFIDTLDFGEEMTVYRFQREGRALLDRFAREGRDCVVAGGTFLYVRALLFPFEFPPVEYPHPDSLDKTDLKDMVQQLLELDPQASQSVDLKNPRRVERALALARSGKTRTEVKESFVNLPLYPSIFIRIKSDPAEVRQRIDLRTHLMMEKGLLAETEKLRTEHPAFASTFRGIGFKEICSRLDSGRSLDGVEEEIAADTRQYARRQRTFLRHQFPYLVCMSREMICEAVCRDSELGGQDMKREKQVSIPLIPLMSLDYTPAIDELYRLGFRAIAVYTLDRGMIEDFANNVALHSPLMQMLFFDDKEIDKGKLPPFSFALPLLKDLRADPIIDQYIREHEIPIKDLGAIEAEVKKR